jgi:Spy/CpxP family protein refolding chaperone
MKNKFRFWIIFSIILVFAAGVIGGIFCEKFLIPKRYEGAERKPPHRPSLERLARELGLTPQQKEQIREAFKRNEERLKELNTDIHGRLQEIRTQLKSEIDNILTPEQRQKLDAMIKKHLPERKRGFEEGEGEFIQKHQQEKDKGEKK